MSGWVSAWAQRRMLEYLDVCPTKAYLARWCLYQISWAISTIILHGVCQVNRSVMDCINLSSGINLGSSTMTCPEYDSYHTVWSG